ncbi:MAG: hypothetical protein H6765_00455 [Candidatus Peribacteria bacterium]|nr:MAG: hypothetical protein H6765_00455 [Candidatus Peribacteria bacterium]
MDTCFQVKPENQLGWDLSLHGVIGLDWQAGHIYTVRAVNINGTLNLVELLDKEVDLSVCTEINDGCNTCEVKNGVISDCSERSCSYMHTNTYQTCTQVK